MSTAMSTAMSRAMSTRALGALAALSLTLVGCGGGSSNPDPTPSGSTSGASTTASTSAPTSAPRSSSPTATQVPVDQIPPGNPKSWVPAGVPTVAKYKEPGDVVPMFTQAMFKRTDTGALAMAGYYLQARDWALATSSSIPYMIICDADACVRSAEFIKSKARIGQHVEGQRYAPGPPTVLRAPSTLTPPADFIVQLRLTTKAGRLVDAKGKVLERAGSYTTKVNLYMKWSKKMWRVVGDFLVG